jgi:small basic protein (TIGR04137 family)
VFELFSRLTYNILAFYLPMSQHRSLKGASTIAARRNVLKRFERVELLKKRGQWKEGQKVLGLPKTKPDV